MWRSHLTNFVANNATGAPLSSSSILLSLSQSRPRLKTITILSSGDLDRYRVIDTSLINLWTEAALNRDEIMRSVACQ